MRRNICFPASGTQRACCTTSRSAVHLLHDNARPHVAKATQAKLKELNWDTVPHPPYSPDIEPSDYHLFRPLNLFLKEKRFAKYEDLKMAVFDFFDSQSAAFWKKGIDDLPERWLTVVTNDGHTRVWYSNQQPNKNT
uniref:Histone-lysine N-methyltransferase SETMAR n=1 Tax=Caenorhabditis japonica TaxID=281687 RepID=A0A8R1DVR7_CAEJA